MSMITRPNSGGCPPSGGSFGWTMLRKCWHLDRSPVRVEVVDALVREVAIVTAPHCPRYKATWVAELGAAHGGAPVRPAYM